jgi:inorganic triphosphatase YgiF
MQDVAIVALAVGSATFFGGVAGTANGFISNWFQSRKTNIRDRDLRAEREHEEHKHAMHAALADVRLTVARVSVRTQLVQDMRRTPGTRLDDSDLSDQIKHTRDDYPIAVAALFGLWTLSRDDETRQAVMALLEDVAWAFQYGRSAGGEDMDPADIDARIKERIKELSAAVMNECDTRALSSPPQSRDDTNLGR